VCGIYGFTMRGTGGDRAVLERMARATAHRGPDDQGEHIDHDVAIGMRRLSIIDLAGGHQPIANEDESIRIVLNGEIYNYAGLREDLLRRGHAFRTRSDTEVILHLFEDEGPDCLHRLRGMFAIAVWDSRRKVLFLARDRLGIKPLYYAARDGGLVFASELKALLQHPSVPRRIDLSAIDRYLTHLYIPSPGTVFEGVRKLPPGHRLSWSGGEPRVERYWDLRFEAPPPGRSLDEAAGELREVLLDSVRAHMVADVPVGALLSGGVDSSSVVALMCAAGFRPKTFSIGFGTKDHDELRYAREVARRYGTDHHEEVVEPDAARLLPAILWHCDEPFADSSAVPTWAVAALARKHLKVVLSGDGGDELFAGYTWLRQSGRAKRMAFLPRALREVLARRVRGFGRGGSLLERAGRMAADSLANPEEGFLRRVSCWTGPLKEACYAADLARAAGPSGDLLAILRDPALPDFGSRMLRADTARYLPDDCLAKVDRMTMAHGLEARVPLVDHRVAEFAARLPFDWKLRGLTTKFILKKALARDLPPVIVRQRKQGFAIPVDGWLRGPLAGTVRRLVTSPRARGRGIFRPEGIDALLEAHASGREDLGQQVWALLCLEVWFRLYIDGPPGESAPEAGLDDL
jgi:asparagine synthase (glutamine-hydrolysing)